MRIVSFIIALIILVACEKGGSTAGNTQDKRYFPLEIGNWVEYEVDSIVLNDFFDPPKIDTFSSLMRLEIIDTFRDNTDGLVYKVNYSWRTADSINWKVANVFTVSDEGNALHVVENNIRLIKLVFPITVSTHWFVDSYFHPNEETDYIGTDTLRYDYIHEPEEINGLSFDSAVSVVAISENLIEKNAYIEKYVSGIGLVYRKHTHLEKQNIIGSWENGFDIEYKVTNYKGL